jgi:heme-degrading monooxygenase HmoA
MHMQTHEDLVVMGSRLRLTSARHLVRFLRASAQVNRQLRNTPGLVDSKLRAQLGSLTFWTLSTWEDDASLRAFARSDPHASLIDDLRRRGAMRSGDFAFWTISRDEPLPTWAEVEARVVAAVSV